MTPSRWLSRAMMAAMGMALAAGLSFVHIASAEDANPTAKTQAKDTKAASEIAQKTCPVMVGKKIKPNLFVEHDGLKVYVCCNDCVEKFKKQPNKYIAEVYRQIYPQQVQTKCPVMGGDVDPKVSAEIDGRTVFFCCKDCIEKYKAQPAKYAAKLKEVTTEQVHCPVSGEAVDPKVSADYQGKKVYFCCKDCVEKFNKDTAKYADTLKPEAGLLARGKNAKDDLLQCAVCSASMGAMKRSAAKTADYKGTTYFLCSDGCVDSFKGDSEKYVKKLAETMKILSSGKRPG